VKVLPFPEKIVRRPRALFRVVLGLKHGTFELAINKMETVLSACKEWYNRLSGDENAVASLHS
jgi:hypothetical protein